VRRPPFSPALLERELRRLVPGWPECRLLIAFSGGADSLALLVALAELRAAAPHRGFSMRAVHVDHGIHPESSAWARAAQRSARRFAVPCGLRRVDVVAARGESPEAAARLARYAALAEAMKPAEVLVTAHHEDDQAETLLLQLLRGAGVAGLAAMPESMPFARGTLVRPLLRVSGSALRSFARDRDLRWVEDLSNADPRFDRNFLRQAVMPSLFARWPGATQVIARAAHHLGEARALLGELADGDLDAVQDGVTLLIPRLQRLSPARQRNVVRRWLERRALRPPDHRRLERVLGELCAARADSLPVVTWRGAEVRRWRERLYAMPSVAPPPPPLIWRPGVAPEIALPAGLGRLRMVADARGPFSRGALPAVLRVSFRAGGERLRTEIGGPRRDLKELMRARNVLPWMRDRIPLLHAGRTLLAVADLWVNAECRAAKATGRRVRIDWVDAPSVKS
jgi:tRNA(Ile)-lysidine synthase